MSPIPKEENRCQFLYKDGRRCRLFRLCEGTIYCYRHEDDLRKRESFRERAAEIVQPTDKLHRARDINRVLARIFREVAAGRMPAEDAARLAYMGQMLLNSLPFIERERERLASLQEKHQTTMGETVATAIGYGIMQQMSSGTPEQKERAERQFHMAREGFEVLEQIANANDPAAGKQDENESDSGKHPVESRPGESKESSPNAE